MSMGLHDKFRMFAGGLLLAVMAVFVLAVVPAPGVASEQSYLGEVSPPSPQPACFERHYPCERGAIATAPAEPVGLDAIPAAEFIEAAAPLPLRKAAPPPAASFSILFRNFRE